MSSRVQVLPAAPFPDESTVHRDFDEVVTVHCTVGFTVEQPTLNAADELGRQSPRTQEQDVAAPQLLRVMMLVRMAHLPQRASTPVHLQHGPAFHTRPRIETA